MNVIVADPHYLIREGVKSILKEFRNVTTVDEVQNSIELHSTLAIRTPHIIIIDFDNYAFSIKDIQYIKNLHKHSQIIAITPNLNKRTITQALKYGVNSYLLKECDRNEVIDAINAVINKKQFFCGRIIDIAMKQEIGEQQDNNAINNCAPICISDREIEIIKLIAEGLTNQEIGEQIFLSTHTVNTHRKNIMKKLEVRNTAGIVMYAVREKLVDIG